MWWFNNGIILLFHCLFKLSFTLEKDGWSLVLNTKCKRRYIKNVSSDFVGGMKISHTVYWGVLQDLVRDHSWGNRIKLQVIWNFQANADFRLKSLVDVPLHPLTKMYFCKEDKDNLYTTSKECKECKGVSRLYLGSYSQFQIAKYICLQSKYVTQQL